VRCNTFSECGFSGAGQSLEARDEVDFLRAFGELKGEPCELCRGNVHARVDGKKARFGVSVVGKVGEALVSDSGSNSVEIGILVVAAWGDEG